MGRAQSRFLDFYRAYLVNFFFSFPFLEYISRPLLIVIVI